MKKLNRKGFTLIELLAVIVIMAIILVVTVPNIINSISDARVSSLHNLAVSVVNAYNTAYAQDLLVTDNNKKKLDTLPNNITSEWKCFDEIVSNGNVYKILGLSNNDIVIDNYNHETDDGLENYNRVVTTDALVNGKMNGIWLNDDSYCSSIRSVNGKIEVILVPRTSGKFAVSGKVVLAYSKDSSARVFEID